MRSALASSVLLEPEPGGALCGVAAHAGGKELADCFESSPRNGYRGNRAGASRGNFELLQRSVPGTARGGHKRIRPGAAPLHGCCGVRDRLLSGWEAPGAVGPVP